MPETEKARLPTVDRLKGLIVVVNLASF